MKNIIFLALVLPLVLTASSNVKVRKPPGPIENIILLCMENHSYDNLLGFMEEPIGDLTGEEFSYILPMFQKGKIQVKKGAAFRTNPDPPHGFGSVHLQQYGTPLPTLNKSRPVDNSGFAMSYMFERQGNPQNIMNIYTPDQVPIISTLARNFQVHKNWFCSVPSCTDPNKFFLYSAQSNGADDNCGWWFCGEQYPLNMTTIFDHVARDGYSWSIHYMDWCEAMAVQPLNENVDNYVHDQDFVRFFDKLHNGGLDTLTYLVPRIFANETLYPYPNTQHPSEDIRAGELLIKQVYENLRNSSYWEKSMLILVYDEHGGFWDSVPTNKTVPNPYPRSPGWPHKFNFDRLGIRVPAIIISPWIARSVVTEGVYEHSSIPATIKNILKLSTPYLTARDATAQQFITLDTLLKEPRQDCPMTLPNVSPSLEEYPLEPMDDAADNEKPHTLEQVRVLGTLLVRRGIITREQLESIAEKHFNDAKNILLFATEAKELLGFKQVIPNRQEYEMKRIVFNYLQSQGATQKIVSLD